MKTPKRPTQLDSSKKANNKPRVFDKYNNNPVALSTRLPRVICRGHSTNKRAVKLSCIIYNQF